MNTATKFQFIMISVVFATIFVSNDCLVFAQTAGEKFKNVKVLTAMPAEQMGKVMNMMSASLGVNCSYCHEGTNFAKENVGHKDDARKMLTMTLGINTAHFEGKPSVTCYTCHRGNTNAASTIPLDSTRDSTIATRALPSHPASKSTVEAILQKHIEACAWVVGAWVVGGCVGGTVCGSSTVCGSTRPECAKPKGVDATRRACPVNVANAWRATSTTGQNGWRRLRL